MSLHIKMVCIYLDGSFIMSKKWYFVYGVVTLILLAPYLWLILDIVDKVSYSKLLLDACLAGPCLLLIAAVWIFVSRIKSYNTQKDEDVE